MKHKKGYLRIYPQLTYVQNYSPEHFAGNVYREYVKLHGGEGQKGTIDFFNLNKALRITPYYQAKKAQQNEFKGVRMSFKRVVAVLDQAVPHVTLEDLIGVKPSASSTPMKRPRHRYIDKPFGWLVARIEQRMNGGSGLYMVSPLRLSKATGIHPSLLNSYLTCRSCPELTNLTLILSTMRISLSELLDGEIRGDMFKASLEKPLPAPLFVPRGLSKAPFMPHPDMDEWEDMGGDLHKTYAKPFTEEEAQAYKKRAREFEGFSRAGDLNDITPEMF